MSSIISLLDRLLDLEIFFEEFYRNIAGSKQVQNDFALKNTALILAKEESRHVEIYQQLIERLKEKEPVEISNDILGQADYFLITLKQSASSYGIMSAGQLIAQAIDIENKQVFLLNKLTDLLRKETATAYIEEVFKKLLEEEMQHVNNLQPFNSNNRTGKA